MQDFTLMLTSNNRRKCEYTECPGIGRIVRKHFETEADKGYVKRSKLL